ncbi:MAG: TlpA family protein disulfide reductase [Flavobacterium sp.]|nr:MAG: TlpA family protein disulfide reductase [Flavobacterium sp.]
MSYEGLGSKTNGYWKAVIASAKPDTVNWIAKDEDTYITYLKGNGKSNEIIERTFSKDNDEPYADYFKRSLLLDKKFGHYLGIYGFYAYQHSYKWEQIDKMIAKLGYQSLLKEFSDERNLVSSTFSHLITEYPFYCATYDAFPADSLTKRKDNYGLLLASKFYKGKVFDYYAAQRIPSKLSSVYKLEDIKKLEKYVQLIGDKALTNEMKLAVASRIKTAASLAAGAPSPLFNLADTSGKFHQLVDMKGKVIYIDLWASWCGPCKEETPHLKKIYEQLKNNDKVQIISIASFDAKNRARRYDIIKKDQMDWLQLEDTDDSFAKSYQANFIPRFIVIDKQGKIVDSDAVRPSDAEKLMTILNREINK